MKLIIVNKFGQAVNSVWKNKGKKDQIAQIKKNT